MRLTGSFVSLFTAALSSLETTDEKHCELGAWVKVESGETQKWFGRVRYVIFVFCFWIDFVMRCHHHHRISESSFSM